jgi:hypothetical protein
MAGLKLLSLGGNLGFIGDEPLEVAADSNCSLDPLFPSNVDTMLSSGCGIRIGDRLLFRAGNGAGVRDEATDSTAPDMIFYMSTDIGRK